MRVGNGLNISFRDSLCFLPMPLSAFTKSFDLQTVKGYFPHKFNLSCNKDYNGELPEKDYYSPDTMSVPARKSFLQWYNKQVGQIFNFKKEILLYCRADVTLLREGVMKFSLVNKQC